MLAVTPRQLDCGIFHLSAATINENAAGRNIGFALSQPFLAAEVIMQGGFIETVQNTALAQQPRHSVAFSACWCAEPLWFRRFCATRCRRGMQSASHRGLSDWFVFSHVPLIGKNLV